MSEVEFDRLLDVVRTAIAPVPGEDLMLASLPIFNTPPRAANDNQLACPLIPLSEGLNAACRSLKAGFTTIARQRRD